MEPNVITQNYGIRITCENHSVVIRDEQDETTLHMAVVTLDKAVFEELQAMCRMAVHMVADMRGDRAYTVAVFLANLFGGEAREFTVQLGGYMPGETETR